MIFYLKMLLLILTSSMIIFQTERWFDKRKRSVPSQRPRRLVSVTTHRLPVQEAMKNGNSINFFNAFR